MKSSRENEELTCCFFSECLKYSFCAFFSKASLGFHKALPNSSFLNNIYTKYCDPINMGHYLIRKNSRQLIKSSKLLSLNHFYISVISNKATETSEMNGCIEQLQHLCVQILGQSLINVFYVTDAKYFE